MRKASRINNPHEGIYHAIIRNNNINNNNVYTNICKHLFGLIIVHPNTYYIHTYYYHLLLDYYTTAIKYTNTWVHTIIHTDTSTNNANHTPV